MTSVAELQQMMAEIQEAAEEISEELLQFESKFGQSAEHIHRLLEGTTRSEDQEMGFALDAATESVKDAAEYLHQAGEKAEEYANQI